MAAVIEVQYESRRTCGLFYVNLVQATKDRQAGEGAVGEAGVNFQPFVASK